jgi:hypothetical protein
MGSVRCAGLRAAGKDKAVLQIGCKQDCQLEVWGVRNHLRVFQRVFGRSLTVSVAGR